MRIPPAAALALLVPILVLGIGGCSSPVEIYFDEMAGMGPYRTWDWLPSEARTIDAPTPYAVGLDRDLARLVEDELARRGFERVARGAELRLGALLNMRREQEVVYETRAVQQLASLHDSPNFEVQETTKRTETYERYRLVVFAVEPRSGRIVWKGAVEQRFPESSESRVERAVEGLLAHFPVVREGDSVPLQATTGERSSEEVSATSPVPPDPDA